MNLRDLPPAVQKLTDLGDVWDVTEWPDYRSLGISAEHIPALIQIIEATEQIWKESTNDEDPEVWLPLHAWRALGQLQAVEALPALMGLLHLIEEMDVDMLQEEIPTVFGMIGPAAVTDLRRYVLDLGHKAWARIAAAEGLNNIAMRYPESRPEVVAALVETLRDYASSDGLYNGFIISYLVDQQAVEAAPLVEEAFLAGKVDETVLGDWEDFQVGIGLLEHRLNPPRSHRLTSMAYNDGLDVPEEVKARLHAAREAKREKQQRKLARASQRKNRKKRKPRK